MRRVALSLSVLLSCTAQAAPMKLLLSIGNDVGAISDVRLHHAQTDAERVSELFLEVGEILPENSVLLLEASAEEVQRALTKLAARAEEQRAQGRAVTLLVYVSSHAQNGTLHLGGSELPLRVLREAVEAVPATVRVLVVDACTSGAAARLKGGQWAPPAQKVEMQPSRGTVVISSSGPAEPSQEWDLLGGSLFTHHWLGALRGQADLDQDGRVTLLEAYGYAWRQTVARADQHPTYDFDLQGAGDLVLTEPRKSPSGLSFAGPLAGRFVVASEPDARVVLEFDKAPGEPMRLAVPPGSYRVRLLRQPEVRVAFVELPWGRVRALGEGDFSNALEPQVALKGGLRSGAVAVETSVLGGGIPSWDLVVFAGVLARLDFSGWWAQVSLEVGNSSAGLAIGRRNDLFGALGLAAGLSVSVGPLRFGLGLHARSLLVLSTLWPGNGPSLQKSQLGLELGPGLSIEWSVVGPLFVGLDAQALLRALQLEERVSPSLGVRGGLVAGFRL